MENDAQFPLVHTAECAAQHFAPWMIDEHWFRSAVEAVKNGSLKPRAQDGKDDSIPPPYTITDGVAVILIAGALMKKKSKFGGTSSVATRSALRKAVIDEEAHSILLHIDSPGGTVAGTGDLAADVRAANAVKPVYAHIEDLGASAAYWVASQAGRITANPTGLIGSIGTLLVLEDSSGKYAADGIKVHVISTGAFKGAGVEGTQVTDEQIAEFQTEVDDLNEHFVSGVAKGRKMPIGAVRSIADGRVHIAAKAKQLNLIDEVSSLDAAVSYIMREHRKMVSAAAATAATNDPTIQTIAPADSQRSEPIPASSTQEPTAMAENTPSAPTAQTPAAVAPGNSIPQGITIDAAESHKREMERIKSLTAEAQYEQGRLKGIGQGRQEQTDRMKSILAICAGKPQMAIEAFLGGQTPESVKLAFDAVAQVEAAAKIREQEKELEIARWQNLAATGGYPGGVPMGAIDRTDDESRPVDAKLQAESEWDHKPSVRKGFSSKDNYVNFRKAELEGRFQMVNSSGPRE